MNTAELKLNIIRQVDTLDDEILQELIDYIQIRVNDSNDTVLDSLSEKQKKEIYQAQESIKQGRGIPHNEVVSKYRLKYGIK